jgi:NADAR domain
VFEGNWWKFSQNRAFRECLIETGERELCEASRADRLWGIGYNAKEALQYRRLWGENLLGKALMRVREKIKERIEEHMQFTRTDWELPDVEMWEVLRREQEEGKERDWQKDDGRKIEETDLENDNALTVEG